MPTTIEPARLSASEVCRLAGYGRVTLRRRVAKGQMPKPVDRGREALFDRRAVEKALGLAAEAEQAEDGWLAAAEELNADAEARRAKGDHTPPVRRDRPPRSSG